MKVKISMGTTVHHDKAVYYAGEVVEVPTTLGNALVAGGSADIVQEALLQVSSKRSEK